jgi:hypothetical protein
LLSDVAVPMKPLFDVAKTVAPAIGCPFVVEVILPEIMPDGSRRMLVVVWLPATTAMPEMVLATWLAGNVTVTL